MGNEIVVRRADPSDLERVSKLAGCLARMHHDADGDRFFLPERVEEGYAWWLGKELQRAGAVVLVALRDDEVVGYAYGAAEDRDWNLLIDRHGAIHDLYVDESVQHSGVGGRLLDSMMAELRALGAPRLVLYTMVKNERAQRLFRSRGFRPTLLEMTCS